MRRFAKFLLAIIFIMLLMMLFGCKVDRCAIAVEAVQEHLTEEFGTEVQVTPSEEFCKCVNKAKDEREAAECYYEHIHTLKVTTEFEVLETTQ